MSIFGNNGVGYIPTVVRKRSTPWYLRLLRYLQYPTTCQAYILPFEEEEEERAPGRVSAFTSGCTTASWYAFKRSSPPPPPDTAAKICVPYLPPAKDDFGVEYAEERDLTRPIRFARNGFAVRLPRSQV